MQLKASAPGSLMLLGEYGVLYGKQALVCAVNKRMTVTMTPRNDQCIEIESALGRYQTTLGAITIEKPFEYILGVLKYYQGRMKRGCHIHVATDFSDKMGLGSSAAVTVAMISALSAWFNAKISSLDLVRRAKSVVQQIQGLGSGADIAASVYGGIVGYQTQPLSAEKFLVTHPLIALYSGYKTPTAVVVKQVQNHFSAHPHLFRSIQNAIGQCALDGMQFMRKENWQRFGEIMNVQQGMMEALGVSNPLLREMIENLRQQPQILGAKISGSGLGDCVVGLGTISADYHASQEEVRLIPIEMTLQGVHCEKI